MTTARRSATLPEPERWTSRSHEGTSIEDQLAGALRTAAEVTLQPPARAAAWVPSPRLARRRRRPVLVLAALLAGAGGVVWATVGGHEQPAVPPPVPSPVAAPPHVPSANGAAPAAPGIAPESQPLSSPAMPETARPAARRRMVKTPPVQKLPQALTPSETEVGLLSAAYRHLRVDRDAAAALVPLEAYARQFPTGALHLEAQVARVEALLMLGRRAEALSALDALPPRIAAPVRQRLQLPPTR